MNITEITSTKKQTAERLRLAPYCRVSSDSTDQLHSFAAQIRYYSDYAKKHPEYQLVDIYADEGITGTEMKKRDELNRLIYRNLFRGVAECYAFSCFHDNVGLRDLPAIRHIKGTDAVVVNP